jgi:hypothetical protein
MELEILVENRKEVVNGFMNLLNEDVEFGISISYSTGTPTRVRKRFRAIDSVIRECL